MKDNGDADYEHPKRVWKNFEIKNLGEYENVYLQSDILLLADLFEILGNRYIEIYELYPAHVHQHQD